ncbi:MAG: extracellular solute-binding protein, partial [Actinomycetota bacterium]|nr:extracellular solute-binding protein [Actinomycetota bacterium]
MSSRRFLQLWVLLLAVAACNPAADDSRGAPPQAGDTAEDTVATGEWPAPEEFSGTLDVWGFGTDNPVGAIRMELFEETYPNVDVELTPGALDEQKFLSAVAGGNPPDVVHLGRDQLGSFAARGAILPLDQYVAASGLDVGVYREAAINAVQIEGQTFGIPQFNNVVVVYLNDQALEEAGLSAEDVDFSDWEGLREVNQQLAEVQGTNVVRIGVDPKLPEFLQLWAVANGGAILSEDGSESLLDSPEVIEAVEFGASLHEAVGGREPFEAFRQSWDVFGGQNQFVEDQVGVTPFEQWYLGVLGEVSPDVGVTVEPFTTRGEGEPISVAFGLAWAVPKGIENPELAFEFMRFMTDAETWVAAAQGDKEATESEGGIYIGTYTANQEADQRIFEEVYEPSGNQAFDQGVQVILEVQDVAVSQPPTAAGNEVQQAYVDAVNDVLLG